MFKLALLAAALLTAAPVAAQAAIDCRIRAMPPASYAPKPLPAVKYQGMPLADLQTLYRRMAGLPARAPGLGYCSDPLGFVYPWKKSGTQTIYYPTDVSDRCQREVIEHEEAHVKGWGINHPSARMQVGPCKGGKSAWPKTVDAS